MGYNGWANYETWVVKLWLDNEEGSYLWVEEQAREARDEWDLADVLKANHQEGFPLEGGSVYSDLLQSALERVDWHEIARAYLEDLESEGGQA